MNLHSSIALLEQAIKEATASECPELMGTFERLKGLALARLMVPNNAPFQRPAESPGRMLTPAEAATIFGVTARCLYRHKKQMPHSQPSRKVLRFPEEPLRRWFASRK